MKDRKIISGLIEQFSVIKDPRIERQKKHKLIDIIVISVCAVLAGAEGWEDIEDFGNQKIKWLKTFLELPHGIPSDDTFARMFSVLDAVEFQNCFHAWVKEINEHLKTSGLIAIDGKTIRRSFDTKNGKSAIHMVSAYCVENHIILGQVKVDSPG